MKAPEPGGFVLLEVMLAIVILAAGVITALESYRASLRVFREGRLRYEATLLMESQVAELERTGRLNPALSAGTTLDHASWEDTVGDSDPAYGVQHRIALRWGTGRRAGMLEQSIYVWK
jgi:Tfp pilus assembly protein PilV